MDDLVQWLEKQFSNDEWIAKKAAAFPYDHPSDAPWERTRLLLARGGHVAIEMRHIAKWDPARVLREIDAKRRMVARIVNHATLMGWDEIHGDLLRSMATVYADRPGYREDWRA